MSSLETIQSASSDSEPDITFTKASVPLPLNLRSLSHKSPPRGKNSKSPKKAKRKQGSKKNVVHFWEDEEDYLVVGPGEHLFEFKTDWDDFENAYFHINVNKVFIEKRSTQSCTCQKVHQTNIFHRAQSNVQRFCFLVHVMIKVNEMSRLQALTYGLSKYKIFVLVRIFYIDRKFWQAQNTSNDN